MFRMQYVQTALTCTLALWMMTASAEEKYPTFDKKPSFCHELDCPYYKVIEKTSDYEIRKYAASVWVSTVFEKGGFMPAQRQGFNKLFSYISGENADGKKIPMTAPVRTRITAADGPFCASKFTVSFFAGYVSSVDVPKPNDDSLFVEETPEMIVYVKSYGGYMTGGNLVRYAAKLANQLKKKGIDIETSDYYACGYDSPFRLLMRHNEIWIPAKASV